MPTIIKWETEDSVLLMPGTADSDTDLKDIDTGEGVLSAAIDNTDGNQYIDFLLSAHLDSATASSVELWMIKSIDGGTIYERGSVSSRVLTAPARPADWSFPLAASADQQHVASGKLLAPSCHFKVLLKWTAGNADVNNSQNMLRYQFANDEAQTA